MYKRFALVFFIDTFTQGIEGSIDNLTNSSFSSVTEWSKEANALASAVARFSWANWFISRSYLVKTAMMGM